MPEVPLRTTERVFLCLWSILILTLKIEAKFNVANTVHGYSYTFTIRRMEIFRR